METPRPTSSVNSRDEDDIPFSPSAQTPPTKSGAIHQLQSVIQTVNRLLWADGFQADILEAIQTLDRMRSSLQGGITKETLQHIETLSKKVVNILTAWTRRNQRISVDARLMKVAKAPTGKDRMPGHIEAAQSLQSFFVNNIAGNHLAPEEPLHGHLIAVGGRLDDAVFSAEQASIDAAALRKEMSERSLRVSSCSGQQEKHNKKGKQNKRKFTLKGLFSKGRGKSNDDITDGVPETVQSDDRFELWREDDALSPLSALPPACLVQPKAQELETTQQAAPEEKHGSLEMISHCQEEHQSVDLGRPGVLSQLEREIRQEFVQRIQAKRAESPEASGSRSWWHERTLKDLDGEEPEEDDEWEWEDCEEEEEQEGTELKFSFEPDETERDL
ncbi:hypothetical protein BKA80DRAFT_250685 [Phyllosticta citrichinensis]